MPWLSKTINGAVDDAWDATGGRFGRWLWKKSWENAKTIKQMEQERNARMAAQYARLVQPPTSDPNEGSMAAIGKGAGFGARQGRVAFVNSLLLGRQPAYRAAAEKFAQDAVDRNDAITTIGLAAGGAEKVSGTVMVDWVDDFLAAKESATKCR